MDKHNQNINVTSYNQQGGITANQVLIGKQERHLTGELKQNLLDRLPNNKKVKIRVVSVLGDQEAFNLAQEIKTYLDNQNYQTQGVDQAIFDRPMVGQFIKEDLDNNIFEIQIGNNP